MLSWLLDPALIASVVAGTLYIVGGHRRLHPHPRRWRWGARQWRTLAFAAGLGTVVLALDSPIDSLSDQLFSVHMLQHTLLLTAAPLLLVLGAPGMRWWRCLPLGARRWLARRLSTSHALALTSRILHWERLAVALFAGDLWIWHLPALYDLTLKSLAVHYLEHATFLVVGILLWLQVLDSAPWRCRLGYIGRAATLLATIGGWLLAVVLAFAPAPLYPGYADLASRPWGLSPLVDQQLGAGVMWGLGSIATSVGIFLSIYRWFEADQQREDAIRSGERLAGRRWGQGPGPAPGPLPEPDQTGGGSAPGPERGHGP